MFWDIPDDPRGSLRWSLSKIRQVLGPSAGCLDAGPETVRLRPDGYWLDVRELARLEPAKAEVERLEDAAALFRGGFLEDLHLPRCPDFESWRVYHANELDILHSRILRELVKRLGGQPERAVPHAHALSRLEPEDKEAAHALEALSAAARRGAAAPPGPPPAPAAPDPIPLAGRRDELSRLEGWLDDALAGRRTIAFVTGEAGIGKTTLVDAFLARASRVPALLVGRGQCIDMRGPGEPFMPVLEALGSLARASPAFRDHLLRAAPTWAAQFPGHAVEALLPREGPTKERMLREVLDLLDVACADSPIVLVIEDLHWSDDATLGLLDALARHRTPARLLALVTCRDGGQGDDTGAHDLTRSLAFRELCRILPLEPLDARAVRDCLEMLVAPPQPGLAELLARRGGGNPLFMRGLLDWWRDNGLLRTDGGELRAPDADSLEKGVPDSLAFLIGRQIDALAPDQRAALEAGSVSGPEFTAAAVASALDASEDGVEDLLHELTRAGTFLNEERELEWPDGTATMAFRFRHQLYRDCIHERLSPAARRRLHRRVGIRLEAAQGESEALAAQLAVHFTEGRDHPRAVRWLEAAARQAIRRSAHQEAIALLDKALALVPRLAAADRSYWEMRIEAIRAPALVATRGCAAPEGEQAFRRACALCSELGDRKRLSWAMFGLAALMEFRGDYSQTQDLLKSRDLALAGEGDPTDDCAAAELMACSCFHNAKFAGAVEHADAAIAAYVASRDLAITAFVGENPLVSSHCWAGRSLWFLGRPDEARARLDEALRIANSDGHSFALALANEQMARLLQHWGDPARSLPHAIRAVTLGEQYGFAYRVAAGTVLRGWGQALTEDAEDSLDDIERGLEMCRQVGAVLEYPYFLYLHAEALEAAGRTDDATSALEQALAQARERNGFFYEAEILRKLGRLSPDPVLARLRFAAALDLARAQGARALETRAEAELNSNAPRG